MGFLTGTLTYSRHCTSTPAAVSRPQVGTQSSSRSSQGFDKAASFHHSFSSVIDFVMRRTMDKPEYGIVLQKQNRLTDLDFVDDIAILVEEENLCQEMTTKLEEQSAQVGLNISLEKTKVMGITQRPSSQPIAVAQGSIEYVERFTYLGSVISRDGDVESDINTRLAKAAAVFRRLDSVWRSSTLSLKIKLDLSLIVSTASRYTPVRPGRVQLEYVSSWTSSTSGIYRRFWALRGRTA